MKKSRFSDSQIMDALKRVAGGRALPKTDGETAAAFERLIKAAVSA